MNQLYRAALLHSPFVQVVLDTGERLIIANHAARVIFGLSQQDVGRPFRDLEMSYRPEERARGMAVPAFATSPPQSAG